MKNFKLFFLFLICWNTQAQLDNIITNYNDLYFDDNFSVTTGYRYYDRLYWDMELNSYTGNTEYTLYDYFNEKLELAFSYPGNRSIEIEFIEPNGSLNRITFEELEYFQQGPEPFFNEFKLTSDSLVFTFPNFISALPTVAIYVMNEQQVELVIHCTVNIPRISSFGLSDEYAIENDSVVVCDLYNEKVYSDFKAYLDNDYLNTFHGDDIHNYYFNNTADSIEIQSFNNSSCNDISLKIDQNDYSLQDNKNPFYEAQDSFSVYRENNHYSDFIQIKELLKYGYASLCSVYGYIWQTEDIVSSPTYKVKLKENTQISLDLIGENNIICPEDTVVIGSSFSSIADTSFKWFRDNSTYGWNMDTITVTRPGIYKAIEQNVEKGKCPVISSPVEVIGSTDCQGVVKGVVKHQDTFEPIANVVLMNGEGNVTISDQDGKFTFYTDPNKSTVSINITSEEYYDPDRYSWFTDAEWKYLTDYRVYTYLLAENDLIVTISSGRNRPGFTIPYYVTVSNRGKNELTTNINLLLDNALTYKTEDDEFSPTSVSGQSLNWANITLGSGEKQSLKFYAELDRLTQLGTILESIVSIDLNDDVLANNIDTSFSEVTGSYDPNDKLVSFNGFAAQGYVHDTTEFEYTIRFQNTGTDTAFTVRIEDIIDSDFDLSTIQTIATSHDYKMTIDHDTVNWIFENILLADSTTNEPASHGFVRFKIKQTQDNPIGTILSNQAGIYFDYNAPIITNEVINEVGDPSIILTASAINKNENITVYPNPSSDYVSIDATGYLVIYNSTGKLVFERAIDISDLINIKSLENGTFHYEFKTETGNYRGNFIKQTY